VKRHFFKTVLSFDRIACNKTPCIESDDSNSLDWEKGVGVAGFEKFSSSIFCFCFKFWIESELSLLFGSGIGKGVETRVF